ncbi:MAG: hypothetical protein ACI802_002611 [Candidatus Paceibacteria bacterium]|jgi:hypothetical protein
MPFPTLTFHRPAFVKNTPALNALTAKGARVADAAINITQQSNPDIPSRRQFGQYRRRVAVLAEMARQRSLLPSPRPAALTDTITEPAQRQTPSASLLTLPADILDRILKSALSDGHLIQELTRLRSTNRHLKEWVDDYLRQSEQRELALRMTCNSIRHMARSNEFNDDEFQVQVKNLIDRSTHVGASVSEIEAPRQRQIVLDCLANATHLVSVDLNASHIPESVGAVLAATTAISAGNPHLTRFQLDMSHDNLGDEVAQLLAANHAITTLDLTRNHIEAQGARALAANTTIEELVLNQNRVGSDGALALAANTRITKLNLSWNKIGDVAMAALAANPTITRLYLSGNDIGAAGAQALARSTHIEELDISINNIYDAGIEALAANTSIKRLNVSYTKMRNAGVWALTRSTFRRELDVRGNLIGNLDLLLLTSNDALTLRAMS